MAAIIAFGWPSPALPKLLAVDSPIPITTEEATWIVSFLKIGLMISPFPAAWLSEKKEYINFLIM